MPEDNGVQGFMGNCRDVRVEPTPPSADSVARGDDVDLVEIARGCQNYLANNPIRDEGWQCRFSFWGLHMPVFEPWPYMGRPLPDIGLIDPIVEGDTDSRMDYAYLFMREMSGAGDAVREAEEGVRNRLLGYIKDDGLSYINGVVAGIPIDDEHAGLWASPGWATSKALYSQAHLFRLTQDESHRDRARHIFEALRGLASWDTGRAYYESPGAWRDNKWNRIGGDTYPWIVEPAAEYWDITGDGEALDFACAFADGMIASLQPSLGAGTVGADGSYRSHAHVHLHAISGVPHLGALISEPRYIEWGRRVYEYVRNMGTDYGWFPESYTLDDHVRHTEICLIADVMYLVTWLAEAGYPEYFDDLERYARNILRSSQFHATKEYEDLYRDVHADKDEGAIEEQLAVMRHIQGGYVACATPNDLVDEGLSHHGAAGDPSMLLDLMGCCPPEGMRALRTVWRHVVTKKPEGVYVNMSLPCEHAEATVRTSLPYRGEVTVVAGRDDDFYLRPPAWAPRKDVVAARNGEAIEARWKGDYIVIPGVRRGEELTMRYPMVRFTQDIDLKAGANSGEYRVDWMGNTVTGIRPDGTHLPLFQNAPRA